MTDEDIKLRTRICPTCKKSIVHSRVYDKRYHEGKLCKSCVRKGKQHSTDSISKMKHIQANRPRATNLQISASLRRHYSAHKRPKESIEKTIANSKDRAKGDKTLQGNIPM